MGKKIIVILAVVIVAIYMVFSDEEQKTSSQVKVATQPQNYRPTPVKPAKMEVGMLEEIGRWPFVGEEKEVELLDSDLNRKNFVVIFDGSGSMGDKKCSGDKTKADVAKDAVSEWSKSVPEGANLGLIVFDQSGLSVRLPLGINNRDQFRQKVQAVIPNYKTPLATSLDRAYQMLNVQGRRQLGYGEYSIVVVTDGVANDPAALGRGVLKITAGSPVMINTIGFCIATNHSLNQAGRTIYKGANDPAALKRGLEEVLAESETFDISAFQ